MKKNFLLLCFYLFFSSLLMSPQVQAQPFEKPVHSHTEDIDSQQNDDNSSTYRSYHLLERLINDNTQVVPFILTSTVSAALSRSKELGTRGFAIGVGLGLLDLCLLSFHPSYDKHHLSFAILGASSFSTLPLPYHIGQWFGAIMGLSISTRSLSPEALQTPFIATVAGHAWKGPLGSLAGICAGLMDENLKSSKHCHRDYLTMLVSSLALSKVFLPQKLSQMSHIPNEAFAVVAYATYLAQSYNDEDAPNTQWSAFELRDQLYDSFNAVIPEQSLDPLLENYIIALLSTKVLGLMLGNHIVGLQQGFFQTFQSLDPSSNMQQKFDQFRHVSLVYFLFNTIKYFEQHMVSKFITNHYQNLIRRTYKDNLRALYWRDENPLKLTDPHSQTLLEHMNRDVDTIATKGSLLLSKALETTIGGFYEIGYLGSQNAIDLGTFVLPAYYLSTQLAGTIANRTAMYDKQLREIETYISTTQKDARKNAKRVVESNAISFIDEKIKDSINKRRGIHIKSFLWILGQDTLSFFTGTNMDVIMIDFLVGQKIALGHLPFDQRLIVATKVKSIANLMFWGGNNAGDLKLTSQSIKALDELVQGIKNDPSYICHKAQYHNEKSTNLAISLQDFRFGLSPKATHRDMDLLAEAENLQLHSGVYAITGRSGSGKSSLLSKLKGYTFDGICSEGMVRYHSKEGTAPKISHVGQDPYWTPHSSLLELVLNESLSEEETEIKQEHRERLESYMKELEFWEPDHSEIQVDEKKDWENQLSGGQKKKLAIIKLLFERPDIALIDETFNGMDSESIQLVQNTLKKELPHSLFLIVDHHASENNFEGFYKAKLNIHNKQILLEDI